MNRPAEDYPTPELCRRIELIVLDTDGVLTDGRVTYSASGEELQTFHVRDGSGMKYWKRVGKKLAIISGRGSAALARRAEELDVDALRMQIKRKKPVYAEVLAKLGATPETTAVLADDLTMLTRCALPVAVADAVPEVLAVADYVTRAAGGAGAVRELIEMICRRAGTWENVLQRYRDDSAKPIGLVEAGEDGP